MNWKGPRFKTAVIGLLSIFFLLVAIPQHIPPQQLPGGIVLDVAAPSRVLSNISLRPLGIDFTKQIEYQLGLDLSGGSRLTYQLDMSEIAEEDRNSAFESARDIIERRINIFGATEPKVQTQQLGDDYRIIVEIPGTTNVAEATALIGTTAQLSFWEEGEGLEEGEEIATEEAALLPFGLTDLYTNPQKTELLGSNLNTSTVTTDPNTGELVVQISFDQEGAELFSDITKRNVGKPVAIVLDNMIISAPVVSGQIPSGEGIITGNFTPDTAKSLTIALNAGALPAPLELVEQNTIGPTLGLESLEKSLIAGMIGLGAVIGFMIAIYRKEGLVASIALIIYTILVLTIFKTLGITLTLAGIAGLILSIGMAVDANILIFERIKEELHLGRPYERAIEIGFKRAWASIRDSNASSLITVFILYVLGTGIIRGFALALGIGIILSMLTAITITRTILRSL